jgi:hypothetical protein
LPQSRAAAFNSMVSCGTLFATSERFKSAKSANRLATRMEAKSPPAPLISKQESNPG